MSWALIAIAATLFVGALFWGVLNPHVVTLTGYASSMSTGPDAAKAATGAQRVMLVWHYWPLWFGGALVMWAFLRATRESRGGL